MAGFHVNLKINFLAAAVAERKRDRAGTCCYQEVRDICGGHELFFALNQVIEHENIISAKIYRHRVQNAVCYYPEKHCNQVGQAIYFCHRSIRERKVLYADCSQITSHDKLLARLESDARQH
jgi:hypothetical protein